MSALDNDVAPRPRAPGRWFHFWSRFNLIGLLFPVGVLVAIELFMVLTGFQRDSVARPSETLLRLIDGLNSGLVFRLTWETLSAALGGVAIGGGIGLLLGVAFGSAPIVYYALSPTTEFIRPIPSIALLPIALLVFGFGYTMEISLIAKTSIWPVMIMTHAAIGNMHPCLREVSNLLQMSIWDRIRKIVLPAVIPSVFVGFRLSMGVSVLVAITVELAANPRGLGYAMMRAEETLQPALMFGLLFWVGVVGWALNAGLRTLQHRLFRNYSVQGKGA